MGTGVYDYAESAVADTPLWQAAANATAMITSVDDVVENWDGSVVRCHPHHIVVFARVWPVFGVL